MLDQTESLSESHSSSAFRFSVELNPGYWTNSDIDRDGSEKWIYEKRAISADIGNMTLFQVRNKSFQGSFLPSNASRDLVSRSDVESVV